MHRTTPASRSSATSIPAAARSLVEKYFGNLKRGPDVAEDHRPRRRRSPPRRGLTVTDTVQLPRVYMSWLTPAIYKPGDADADLDGQYPGWGKVEPALQVAGLRQADCAGGVRRRQESLILGSKFTIEATARPGHTAEELEAAINAELRRLHRDGSGGRRGRARPEHHRNEDHPGPGEARRVRRQGRSPEQLRALPGNTRLSRPGSASDTATRPAEAIKAFAAAAT